MRRRDARYIGLMSLDMGNADDVLLGQRMLDGHHEFQSTGWFPGSQWDAWFCGMFYSMPFFIFIA